MGNRPSYFRLDPLELHRYLLEFKTNMNEINKIISDGKIESRGTKEEILPLLQGGMKNCLCQMKEVALTDERYND